MNNSINNSIPLIIINEKEKKINCNKITIISIILFNLLSLILIIYVIIKCFINNNKPYCL